MRTIWRARMAALSLAIAFCGSSFGGARETAQVNVETIACRALEVHASETPAVTAVIFHQQNKDDQTRLGEFLRMHSGESLEIQIRGEPWTRASVFRLKSCFGRGLLLLPPGAPAIKNGATFVLRLPEVSTN